MIKLVKYLFIIIVYQICSFSVYATGASNSGDVVTFSNITIQDGFYAIATTDTNL